MSHENIKEDTYVTVMKEMGINREIKIAAYAIVLHLTLAGIVSCFIYR